MCEVNILYVGYPVLINIVLTVREVYTSWGYIMNTVIYVRTTYLLNHRLHVSTQN